MRLPRYARGLKLVRIGVFLMLLQLVLSIVVVAKMYTSDSPNDAFDSMQWLRYLLWVNTGAHGAMLVGTLMAVPDFRLARMPTGALVFAATAFAIAAGALLWTNDVVTAFLDAAADPLNSLDDLERATGRMDSLWLATIAKDVAYALGLGAIVRSIRQTAVVNEHYALRDAAGTVGGLVGAMLGLDILNQVVSSVAIGLLALFAIVLAIGVLVFWVYTHLRLAKFLRAAATLVNEPHHLPVATIVHPARSAPDPRPKPPVRPTAPARVKATPSATLIVTTNLRPVPTPRADTAPGQPADEPKLLR